MDEVDRQIALLDSLDLGVIDVSAHDSSDEVIARVRRVFGQRYRDVAVGREILISAD
jgi:hypothetical protein